jgi:hypothetical protein
METGFQEELANWGPFYGFVGTASVTLLGLLFVAVSLRLNIFRDAEIADVRDFARLALFSFLAPMVISGVTLAPHDQPLTLALPLFVVSAVGVAATIYVTVEWVRLNPPRPGGRPGLDPRHVSSWITMGIIGLPYVALAIIGVLFLLGRELAYGALGAAEGWMLITGTIIAWGMLSSAGSTPQA